MSAPGTTRIPSDLLLGCLVRTTDNCNQSFWGKLHKYGNGKYYILYPHGHTELLGYDEKVQIKSLYLNQQKLQLEHSQNV